MESYKKNNNRSAKAVDIASTPIGIRKHSFASLALRSLSCALALTLTACGDTDSGATTAEPAMEKATAPAPVARTTSVPANPLKNAYFGDLHVHTTYSFDAFIFGTRATPDDAYEFAKGGALTHPGGMTMKMPAALDFQAVTDHGLYLGMLPAMADPTSAVGKHPAAIAMREADTPAKRTASFQNLIGYLSGTIEDDLFDESISRNTWKEIVAAAERNNHPGKFTAFIGYEYTSSGPEFQNLHRNVIYRGSKAPDMIFTAAQSRNPEDLWDWMDNERSQNRDLLAMPHNSNGSDGWMFSRNQFGGEPMDVNYAEQRMRNEPLVEISQVKGTSETHPALSPNDEWADFEIMPLRVASSLPSRPQGSYVREALLNGLQMQEDNGFNPYRFGFIGSSDTHNAAGSFEEYNYWSKTGLLDATPQLRGSVPLDKPTEDGEIYAQPAAQYWGASGLAGVWADANTRASLFDAMRKKETFGTSGPRIRVRFFAGFGFADDIVTRSDNIAHAYDKGVPMGSDLLPQGNASPQFYVWAAKAADSAPLQRVQIVKGWLTNGETVERVFDVACSDGNLPDTKTQRCPDNGAQVNLQTCAYSKDSGAGELAATWQDPNFDPSQRAFYYVRVLENPTCRWSTWDAIRAGAPLRPDMHAAIQERAWSSPIWFEPG